MEWKSFLATSAYICMVCDAAGVLNPIINMTLVDGLTPNEGRVEYMRSEDSFWQTACGDGIDIIDASVICRQLGYRAVNKIITQWPERGDSSIAQHHLNCMGGEETLNSCSLLDISGHCDTQGGVICYDRSYDGCFSYPVSALDDLEAPCDDNFPSLTISKCVSLCYHTSNAYTSAGMYKGNMCLCGKASTAINQSENMDAMFCSSQCAGREIENCGGPSHIALFNITLFLQNNNVTPSPIGCEELTPAPTEGDLSTTTVSNVSSSSPSRSSMPSTSHKVTAGTSSMTAVQNTRGDLSTTTVSNVSSTSPSRSSMPSTSHTVSAGTSSMTAVQNTRGDATSTESATSYQSTSDPVETSDGFTIETMTMKLSSMEAIQTSQGMTSYMGSRSRTPTGMPQRTTKERTMGMRGNLGLYIGVGAGGGVLVLILLILMIVFIIRWRRSKDKRSSKDHTILELRSRPEGSDLDVYPHPSASSHNYSLENGHTNPMLFNDIMEDSDYSVIAETSMNARNSSAYEHVPQLESISDNRRSPQPEPRKSVREGQYSMHPDTSELYTKPDKSQQENGHSDSFPEYAVSQKVRKEHIGQAVPELPPSALNPEDVAGLYTMPDKSKKTTKLLDRNMDSDMGIDNALYICRGDENAEVARESSEYAVGNNDVDMNADEGGDGDTEMIENELYETSDRHT